MHNSTSNPLDLCRSCREWLKDGNRCMRLQQQCISGEFHSILGDREKCRGTFKDTVKRFWNGSVDNVLKVYSCDLFTWQHAGAEWCRQIIYQLSNDAVVRTPVCLCRVYLAYVKQKVPWQTPRTGGGYSTYKNPHLHDIPYSHWVSTHPPMTVWPSMTIPREDDGTGIHTQYLPVCLWVHEWMSTDMCACCILNDSVEDLHDICTPFTCHFQLTFPMCHIPFSIWSDFTCLAQGTA